MKKEYVQRIFVSLLALIIATDAKTQIADISSYNFQYTDTVTVTVPDELIEGAISNIAQQKNIPDSMVSELRETFMISLISKQPFQIQDRFVKASPDSTIVFLSPDVQHKGLTIPLAYSKMVISNGRYISKVFDLNGRSLPIPIDDGRAFTPTGRKRNIQGFLCEEYAAKAGAVCIWITKSLPSSVNPGIKFVNVDGAILAFRIKGANDSISSTLTQIHR